MNWHTRNEREAIRRLGGRPLVKYGYDGLLNRRPVEVREARKDNRYRIQKDVHQSLVRQGGSYIFLYKGKSRKVKASRVSRMLGGGGWFEDRSYPHKFLKVEQVFRKPK